LATISSGHFNICRSNFDLSQKKGREKSAFAGDVIKAVWA
jgi:hypothetical protein